MVQVSAKLLYGSSITLAGELDYLLVQLGIQMMFLTVPSFEPCSRRGSMVVIRLDIEYYIFICSGWNVKVQLSRWIMLNFETAQNKLGCMTDKISNDQMSPILLRCIQQPCGYNVTGQLQSRGILQGQRRLRYFIPYCIRPRLRCYKRS